MENLYHRLLIKLHQKYNCLFNYKETFLEDNGCQDPDVISHWITEFLGGGESLYDISFRLNRIIMYCQLFAS